MAPKYILIVIVKDISSNAMYLRQLQFKHLQHTQYNTFTIPNFAFFFLTRAQREHL